MLEWRHASAKRRTGRARAAILIEALPETGAPLRGNLDASAAQEEDARNPEHALAWDVGPPE